MDALRRRRPHLHAQRLQDDRVRLSSSYNTGFLLNHEGIYYALEAVPVLLCVGLFAASHPARYLSQDREASTQEASVRAEQGSYELTKHASD